MPEHFLVVSERTQNPMRGPHTTHVKMLTLRVYDPGCGGASTSEKHSLHGKIHTKLKKSKILNFYRPNDLSDLSIFFIVTSIKSVVNAASKP